MGGKGLVWGGSLDDNNWGVAEKEMLVDVNLQHRAIPHPSSGASAAQVRNHQKHTLCTTL